MSTDTTSTESLLGQIQEFVNSSLQEDGTVISSRDEWNRITKLIEDFPPANSTLTPEFMWVQIWKELDKRGVYDRNAAPTGHDPTFIYNAIKVTPFLYIFEDTHPVDALFIGYFLRNLNKLHQARVAYQFAADKGNIDAIIGLGCIADDLDQDYGTAESYFRDALDKGMVRAYLNLGNLYRFRLNNRAEGLKMYMKGAALGNIACTYNSALLCDDPSYSESYNPEMVNEFLDRAIAAGHPLSMYMKGLKLCDQGSTDVSDVSAEEMGKMLKEGLGLIKQSAKLGYSRAMERLIMYYRSTRNLEKFLYWTELLIEKGDFVTKEFLSTIFQYNTSTGMTIAPEVQDMMNSLPDDHLGYLISPK